MIVLKQQINSLKCDLKKMEKDLNEVWNEEVRIIPFGYDLAYTQESKNDYIMMKEKDKSDLFILSKNQLRLLKAGLEARDNHNVRIINERMTIYKGLDDIYSNEAIIESCREEHKDILTLVKKIDRILNDPWYEKYVPFTIPKDKELKDKKNNSIVVDVDLNIDKAKQKIEQIKSLMLEPSDTDISSDKVSIKSKKMQDIEKLLKDIDGIEISSESITLNGDGYKPLSKGEYIDYMIETRRKSLEERWLKICKGCDYIFLGNDECLGEMFYSFHYIKNKAKDSKVTLFEEN